jgi:hypothetical protein
MFFSAGAQTPFPEKLFPQGAGAGRLQPDRNDLARGGKNIGKGITEIVEKSRQ